MQQLAQRCVKAKVEAAVQKSHRFLVTEQAKRARSRIEPQNSQRQAMRAEFGGVANRSRSRMALPAEQRLPLAPPDRLIPLRPPRYIVQVRTGTSPRESHRRTAAKAGAPLGGA